MFKLQGTTSVTGSDVRLLTSLIMFSMLEGASVAVHYGAIQSAQHIIIINP
jgi:hypothetical protein